MLTLKRRLQLVHDRAPTTTNAPVTIEYCVPSNYERVARQLASAILRAFGFQPQLVPSRGGVFEVKVDGRLIFSKRATWRFPDQDEVFYHVQNRKS